MKESNYSIQSLVLIFAAVSLSPSLALASQYGRIHGSAEGWAGVGTAKAVASRHHANVARSASKRSNAVKSAKQSQSPASAVDLNRQ